MRHSIDSGSISAILGVDSSRKSLSMSATCPVCHKPTTDQSKPFCGERCRSVDMNRWFSGGYAVPAVELDDVDADALDAAENLENPDHS